MLLLGLENNKIAVITVLSLSVGSMCEQTLFEAGADGSWLTVVNGAGHAQFCDGRWNGLGDGSCGVGPDSREVGERIFPGRFAVEECPLCWEAVGVVVRVLGACLYQ